MCLPRVLAAISLLISTNLNTITASTSQLNIGPIKSDSNLSNPTSFGRQLIHAAPYAINSNNDNMRNVVFRLTLDQKSGDSNRSGQNPWTLVSQNGTLLASSVNFNLQKLLETLNNSNYTGEVSFDDNENGIVNITISNYNESEKGTLIEELILEELLMDSNLNLHLNGSSVVKDNHRYESKLPLRSKPSNLELSITPPPIRGAIEVVAENYTVRKIAEEANVFSLKLLHQLNIEKLGSRNLIQSPFAIYQGLSLLLTGAMGDTAKEMDKALLGKQSPYENTRLTHDQDRVRLLASLSDVIKQLHYTSTHHLRSYNESDYIYPNGMSYSGGTAEQHLIVANNLLFSPSAFEISNEFKSTLNTYYDNTAVTKIEVGSTESIQVVNSWIRKVTGGTIPSVLDRKNTFDEFNVMALLCTSWLAQEWKDKFYRISSPLRSSIRLKGQARLLDPYTVARDNNLLEFVDDNKRSHFVDYIKSEPTKNIHHFHSAINGLVVDIVVVPFHDSNHRLIALTPISVNSPVNSTQQLPETLAGTAISGQITQSNTAPNSPTVEPPDSSLLSRLIAAFAGNPRKAMRSLWNIVSPDIITKQTLKNLQLARQKNVTIEDQTIETNIPPLVQVSIPLIRTEADSSVSAALNHIGIVNSFDPDQANFIGLNGHPFNYYKLHLSNVIAKTTFNLNERGINYDKTIKTLESLRILPLRQLDRSGGAGAEENGHKTELIDDVKLNKPFVYVICDLKTRLVLYTGVLRNPSQEGP